jgi:soluble lytic murein transglycosylase-like protein
MRKIGLALLALWPGLATAAPKTCGSGVEMIRHEAGLDADFDKASRLFRIDPDLGRAVAAEESRFVVNAISSKGAMGLMQLMPETSESMGVRDPFDPHQNIYGGMRYLRFLADDPRFVDSPYMVLVAYGAGPNHSTFPQEAYRAADVVTATYWQLKARPGN